MNGFIRCCVVPAALLCLAMFGEAGAQTAEKPVRGQDLIHNPAIEEGLCAHNLFQSNMVLQREKPISIWGWADAGETVSVTFDGKEQTATAARDRSWKVTFAALPASDQPRTLVIKGKSKTLTLDNILIGDVWLCGGQSNMEFPLERTDSGDLEIASANFKNIRLLTIPSDATRTPVKSFPRLDQWSGWDSQHFRKGFWDECTPKSVPDFSGIGYVFARRLYMATQVPIGMIDVSRGGTSVETWTPIEVLRSMDSPEVKKVLADWDAKVRDWDPKKDLEQRVERFRQRKKDGKTAPDAKEPTEPGPGPLLDMNLPGNCYGGMFAPMAGLPVKGAIWHQGYNNAMTDSSRCGVFYHDVLIQMIAAWRKALDSPDMAFGILSLCTDQQPQSLENFLSGMTDNGCLVREAQRKVYEDLAKAGDKNIGFASSDDLRRNWFHPQNKIPAGERMARWAMATQYGMNIRWQPPTVKEMKVQDAKLVLKLDFDSGTYDSNPIYGFMIAGEDKKFYPATAVFPTVENRGHDRSTIVLDSPFVASPVAYRYGWHRNPMGNIRSGDLPMPILRSDTWTLNDLYEAYTGKKTASPVELSRAERGTLNKAMTSADKERRFKEAEAYVKEHQAD